MLRAVKGKRNLSVWNAAHLCFNATNFLNLINKPRHAILPQTSSISDPDRTFTVSYAKVDRADFAPLVVINKRTRIDCHRLMA